MLPIPVNTLISDWLASVARDPWPDTVTVLLVALAAVLYWRGARYQAGTGHRRPSAPEAVSFGLGLLLLLLAVVSPLDTLGEEALAFRLIQHELLVLAVAPLLLMGAPLWPWWLALPPNWRQISLQWLLQHSWAKRLGTSIGRIIAAPLPIWFVFTTVFVAWHTPPVFDWGQESEGFRGLLDAVSLAAALLFWAQVIPSYPLQPRLRYAMRVGYVLSASLILHLVSLAIAIAVEPIYPFYGTSPAVVSQQPAGGAIMDVGGQLVFTTAIVICAYLWLQEDERKHLQRAAGTADHAVVPTATSAILVADGEFVEPQEDMSRT